MNQNEKSEKKKKQYISIFAFDKRHWEIDVNKKEK